ncbi:MAG: molybdopterin-dependent oxidoreductase, partial [Pseudomonadota bacterium]
MKTKDHRRPLTSMHWGVYEVQRDNHGAPILAPFADDPDPNPIGLHALGPELADARVKRPAIRAGWLNADKRKRRGEDDFIEVSWDTALDAVASELSRIKTRYGNDAIFGGSYGWSSAGRFHHAQSQIHRFLNCFGGYVRHRDSYSLGAGRVLMPHIFVGLDDLFVTQTSWDVMAQHTELFVTFGGVPSKNAQVAAGGTTEHRIPSALRNMASSGTRFVNISPVRDDLDIEAAWLPVRPNTDTALMLALAQVLVVEGFVNQAFVARCTVGYEQLAAYICGEHDGVAKTPEWAAPICDISAESIRALARDMATHRTMLNIAWALQRADHGEQPFWMLVALGAMLGQIGLPGGGVGIGYGATNTMGSPHVRIKGPTLAQGTNPVAAFIPVARIADCLLNPGQPFEYNGEEHRYPDLRLVYWAGGNPFHHHQDLNRLREAF